MASGQTEAPNRILLGTSTSIRWQPASTGPLGQASKRCSKFEHLLLQYEGFEPQTLHTAAFTAFETRGTLQMLDRSIGTVQHPHQHVLSDHPIDH